MKTCVDCKAELPESEFYVVVGKRLRFCKKCNSTRCLAYYRRKKAGLANKTRLSPEELRLHERWYGMVRRCHNPADRDYRRYGGRGISVCDEWRYDRDSFTAWAVANGYSFGLEIDRINNDDGYSPSNCRWTTRLVQNLNQSRCRRLFCFGETKAISEWARDPRIEKSWMCIAGRLKRGWDVQSALLQPVNKGTGWRQYGV